MVNPLAKKKVTGCKKGAKKDAARFQRRVLDRKAIKDGLNG